MHHLTFDEDISLGLCLLQLDAVASLIRQHSVLDVERVGGAIGDDLVAPSCGNLFTLLEPLGGNIGMGDDTGQCGCLGLHDADVLQRLEELYRLLCKTQTGSDVTMTLYTTTRWHFKQDARQMKILKLLQSYNSIIFHKGQKSQIRYFSRNMHAVHTFICFVVIRYVLNDFNHTCWDYFSTGTRGNGMVVNEAIWQ